VTSSIKEWLGDVVRKEKPKRSIIAFNVGLFESPDGYTAYLSGSKQYSADDPGWACDEDFTPQQRYCVLSEMKERSWEQVQRSVVRSVRSFLASPAGARSFLAKARAVTVGFDDGDLVPVKKT
jgi:hypothetical protein